MFTMLSCPVIINPDEERALGGRGAHYGDLGAHELGFSCIHAFGICVKRDVVVRANKSTSGKQGYPNE